MKELTEHNVSCIEKHRWEWSNINDVYIGVLAQPMNTSLEILLNVKSVNRIEILNGHISEGVSYVICTVCELI